MRLDAKAECENERAAREDAVEMGGEVVVRNEDAWGTEGRRTGL